MLVGILNFNKLAVLYLFINTSVHSFSPEKSPLNGILNVYKPYGLKSNYLVNRIRSIIAENHPSKKKYTSLHYHVFRLKIRVGHGGTLDKYAEGVLAIGIGQGTKHLTEYLKGEKEYQCCATFGFETDTNDLVGDTTHSARWDHITLEMLDKAIMTMKGFQLQEAPIYSAKKFSGIPLYKYALKDKEVPPKFSLINVIDIYRTKTEEFPNFSLFVRCSGGTYVRSLVRDLGRRLNSRATMVSLVRTKKLNLSVEDSIPLRDLNYENIVKHIQTVK